MRAFVTTAAAGCFFLSLAATGSTQQAIATGNVIRGLSLAVTGAGDFIVVWNDVDFRQGNINSRVYARLLDASGNPKGAAFLVGEDLSGNPSEAKVAAGARGSFVVVWQEARPGEAARVLVQRFDRRGRRLGPPIRASRSATGHAVLPNVAMRADGSFVVAWRECSRHNDCPSLRVSRFLASGERRGRDLEIPAAVELDDDGFPIPPTAPLLAAGPDGFSVGWTERRQCNRFDLETFSIVEHFEDSGGAAGDLRLDDGICDGTGWQLAALTADGSGSSAAFFNGVRNSFQLFDADGEPAGPRTVIGRPNACPEGGAHGRGCEKISSVAMAPDGRFAVVWELKRTTRDFAEVQTFLMAQLFDPEGRPLGERFPVASSFQLIAESAAVLTEDGTLAVVWSQADVEGPGYRLLMRQVRLD